MPTHPDISSPLRLSLDRAALQHNWQSLARMSGKAACGAAIKANGYGLGARRVMTHLAAAGCRDFFVATWAEAQTLMPIASGLSLSVLHGVRTEDMAVAIGGAARPVLSTPEQIARWRQAGGGACDVMIDTGMNRLGLDWQSDVAGLVNGLKIEVLMSHLACADDDNPLSALQRQRFAALTQQIPASRYSLANSAGICLGADYHFDLTRPGVALYGGVPRNEATGKLRQVVTPQAQVLQQRVVRAGDQVGYNATYTAQRDTPVVVLNIGYADGYLRGFSGTGRVLAGAAALPVIGRVSMDLLIVDATDAPDVGEGDWLDIDYDLPTAAAASGLSQYELLTGLGQRFERRWV
ncbi:MAG: alanine racemase [Sphingobium sp.]|uniref:alanine racemase n=1 Tax=Sphingobium sp. TaxID=1912891 RepID=UPI0029A5720B|nr:alanine racemase [Sphingobium sp.]MDX3908539.1 alanine racemase [Sphingobium sp.]